MSAVLPVPGKTEAGARGAASDRSVDDLAIGLALQEYLQPRTGDDATASVNAGSGDRPGELSLEPRLAASSREDARTPGEVETGRDPQPAPFRDDRRESLARSHTPFVVALGLLGLCALAVGAHFWSELHPTAPLGVAARPPIAAANAAPPPAPATRAEIPGLPSEVVPPSRGPTVPSERPARPLPTSTVPPTNRSIPVDPPTAARPLPDAPVRPRPPDRVHPKVEAAYAALRANDLAGARAGYLEALEEEPLSRDARLGMAAIETHARRFAHAEAHLHRLLSANPADAHAQAALIALRAEEVDPRWAESQLKTLLPGDPESAALHFLLGNQYARQHRWAEAREAYLRAQHRDPDHPDIAFNLAVACDRLGRAGEARGQYQRALNAADRRTAEFPSAAAQRRLVELAR